MRCIANKDIAQLIVRQCCDRKARAASAQSFALRQQATIEITRRDHSIIACSYHIYMGVVLRAYPVRGESHIQRNASGEVATPCTQNPGDSSNVCVCFYRSRIFQQMTTVTCSRWTQNRLYAVV